VLDSEQARPVAPRCNQPAARTLDLSGHLQESRAPSCGSTVRSICWPAVASQKKDESAPYRREEAPGLELLAFWQDEVRAFPLPSEGVVTIGRAPENAICIDNPSVSRQHASLHVAENVLIEDLGGTNGTFVRNRQVVAREDTVGLQQLSRDTAELSVGESAMLGEVSIVLRRAASDRSGVAGEGPGRDAVLVRDPVMKAVYDQAELAAQSNISVMICGETGVGKEVMARTIHNRSSRSAQPLMSINCAALSGTLLEGELFGYEKGAFTGATHARPGLFEAANGGSVFLDELGELPASTQAKLLRLIEERTVMRLGGRSPRAVDVRFISATNRELEAEIARGGFRSDLYYRLNGLTLVVPPLRERRADIEPLARRFLTLACQQLDRADVPTLSAQALTLLEKYHWPGNARELRNVIERAVVLCRERTIDVSHLPSTLRAVSVAPATQARPAAPLGPVRTELKELERARIVEALARSSGNQTQAAKLLGMSRRTLVERLVEFNLPRPRKFNSGSE